MLTTRFKLKMFPLALLFFLFPMGTYSRFRKPPPLSSMSPRSSARRRATSVVDPSFFSTFPTGTDARRRSPPRWFSIRRRAMVVAPKTKSVRRQGQGASQSVGGSLAERSPSSRCQTGKSAWAAGNAGAVAVHSVDRYLVLLRPLRIRASRGIGIVSSRLFERRRTKSRSSIECRWEMQGYFQTALKIKAIEKSQKLAGGGRGGGRKEKRPHDGASDNSLLRRMHPIPRHSGTTPSRQPRVQPPSFSPKHQRNSAHSTMPARDGALCLAPIGGVCRPR